MFIKNPVDLTQTTHLRTSLSLLLVGHKKQKKKSAMLIIVYGDGIIYDVDALEFLSKKEGEKEKG